LAEPLLSARAPDLVDVVIWTGVQDRHASVGETRTQRVSAPKRAPCTRWQSCQSAAPVGHSGWARAARSPLAGVRWPEARAWMRHCQREHLARPDMHPGRRACVGRAHGVRHFRALASESCVVRAAAAVQARPRPPMLSHWPASAMCSRTYTGTAPAGIVPPATSIACARSRT
jgi:hypothetical protein